MSNWITLTRVSGAIIHVNIDKITNIEVSRTDKTAVQRMTKSYIRQGSVSYSVKETADEIFALISIAEPDTVGALKQLFRHQ